MPFFVDAAPSALGKLERTPQGGYIAPAAVARAGVMLYTADQMRSQGLNVPSTIPKGGIVRVYTPPEVLQAACDSMRTAPVTNKHPKRMVSPETFSSVCRGSVVSDTCVFEDGMLKAKLAIQDAGLLRQIELGESREVSMGYYADTEFTPGKTPEGEEYDAIRTGILYNHVAIVPKGRAGAQVCLALDSDEIPTEDEGPVKFKVKIKGAEVELDAAELQGQIDRLEGEIAAATAEATQARAAVQAATADEAIDALVQKRLEAKRAAEEAARKRKEVSDAYPEISLDGKSDLYVDGLYDRLQLERASDPDDVARATGRRGPKTAPATDAAETQPRVHPRQKMLEANRNAWRAQS